MEQLERVQRKAARTELDQTKNWKAYKRQQPLSMKSLIRVLFQSFMARVKKYQKFLSVEFNFPLLAKAGTLYICEYLQTGGGKVCAHVRDIQ